MQLGTKRKDSTSGRAFAQFADCHTDEVTQVCFHPHLESQLFSACLDGLVCIFDYSLGVTEDEAYQSGLNIENAINKIGFFGDNGKFMYCTTPTEQLSLWDLEMEQNHISFGLNFRDQLSQCSTLPIRYLVDCKFTPATNQLLLFAGSADGVTGIFEIRQNSIVILEKLVNGHNDVIRALCCSDDGALVITGGDDARVCFWKRK